VNRTFLERPDTITPTSKASDAIGELSVEELGRAVGEHALLQTEVNRQMALRIVEMREEMREAKKQIESLQERIDGLIGSMAQALEMMQPEWQRKSTASSNGAKAGVTPRLLNAEKLLKMGAQIRLNIGCGTKPLPKYLNVDERELEGVDLIADARSLPFRAESVSEIRAAHLVEHFTEPELKATVLPSWHRLLKRDGALVVAVPDAEGMIQAFGRGELPFEDLRTVTYGGQDYAGNFHYTMFSRDSLRAILREAGFCVDEYAAQARPNGLCLEMEIQAKKM
jgi:predicted SAM-dependent methyltransferase